MLEIHLILIFMIGAAVIAVTAKDLVSSVIAVGGVGIGLCMAFLALKAPDLAITQLVVEILSLIILVRGTIRRDLPFSMSGRWYFNTIATLAFLAVFLSCSFYIVRDLPAFGAAGMRVSNQFISLTLAEGGGSLNVVESIALHFRAIDTLGEVTALFAAIIGVLAIARRVAREGKA